MSHQNKSARTTATTATGPTDQGIVTGDFWGMYISDDKLRVDSQSDMCHSELRELQELLELAHSSATCLAPGSSSREVYLWGVLSLCMSKVESAQRSLQLRDSLLTSEFAVMVARHVRRRRNEEAGVQQQGEGRAARRDGSSCEDDDDWVLVLAE